MAFSPFKGGERFISLCQGLRIAAHTLEWF
ncbi:MAG: hypothetical protein KIPDCIKN_02069 [Haliscomenobacter sp.]|nr:hypothetical protein [Haliscomenobacter sp.]